MHGLYNVEREIDDDNVVDPLGFAEGIGFRALVDGIRHP